MNSPSSTRENSPLDPLSSTSVSLSSKKESAKRSFIKLKTYSSKGEWVIPEKKNYYDDLNTIFKEGNMNLGHFQGSCYDVSRSYISTEARTDSKLFYSKLQPHENSKAQICFIHGLEDHSGRYLTVKHNFENYFIDFNFY